MTLTSRTYGIISHVPDPLRFNDEIDGYPIKRHWLLDGQGITIVTDESVFEGLK